MNLIWNNMHANAYCCLFIIIFSAKTFGIIRHFNRYGPCDVLSVQESLYISGIECESLENIKPSFNVTNIFINGTSIATLAVHNFNKFPHLLYIEIVHSKLQFLELDSFCNLTELKTLNISHNEISEIRSERFCNLQNLTSLVLSYNNITNLKDINQDISENMPFLTYLDFSSNNLTSVESDDFVALNNSNLEVLQLSNCKLHYIHPNSLTNLRKLKTLIISKNNLTEDNLQQIFTNLAEYPLENLDMVSLPYSLHMLTALDKLNLNRLRIGDVIIPIINKTIFSSLDLSELTIINADVVEITDDVFEYLSNLTSLTIVPNILDTLPRGVLLRRLELLNMSGRPWMPKKLIIPDFSFSSMNNLKTLDLSFNYLIRIKEGTFSGLSNLQHLYLRRCGIHHVEGESFAVFYNLLSLDISINSILIRKLLIKKMFKYFKNLKKLAFQQVPITLSATDNPFSELVNLEYIDLTNTSLNLVSQNLFSNLSKLQNIYLSHNLIREWRKPIFSLLPNIVSVDLSHNLIVTATAEMLRDFAKIRYVDLSGNYFNCSCDLLSFLDWSNSSKIISGYFKRDYNSYKCDSPKELYNSELYKVHSILQRECYSNPAFAALISLTVILILTFVAVVAGYLYKLRSQRKLLNFSDNKNYTYDAFISYNANDSEWVFSILLPHLETNSNDLKLCVYDRDFLAGSGISECIMDSIKSSRRTILILSNNFLQSPWCKFETDLAHHVLIDEEREGLLLIKLEKLSEHLLSPQLNYLLKTKIYLEWSDKPKEQDLFWKKLRKALESKKKAMAKII